MMTQNQALKQIGALADQNKARAVIEFVEEQARARWRCPTCKAAPGSDCLGAGAERMHHARRTVFVFGLLRHAEELSRKGNAR